MQPIPIQIPPNLHPPEVQALGKCWALLTDHNNGHRRCIWRIIVCDTRLLLRGHTFN